MIDAIKQVIFGFQALAALYMIVKFGSSIHFYAKDVRGNTAEVVVSKDFKGYHVEKVEKK